MVKGSGLGGLELKFNSNNDTSDHNSNKTPDHNHINDTNNHGNINKHGHTLKLKA